MPRRIHAGSVTRFVLVLTGCLLGLILAAGWMVRRDIEQTKSAAMDLATRVMDALQARPKVVVNHRTIVEQQRATLKLVTLEKTLTERQSINDSWLHSTKTLEIEADLVIRGGFDFEKPFVVEIDRTASDLRVTLPPAEILSVELTDIRFLQEENGWWNTISSDDRERAIRELRARVTKEIQKSDFVQQARKAGESRIAKLLETDGQRVTFPPIPQDRLP